MNNILSKKTVNTYFRYLALTIIVFSSCLLIFNFISLPKINKIIFYYNQIVFILCILLALFCFFKPTMWQIFCCINTLLTTTALISNHIFMGLFFYFSTFLIVLSTGYYKTHFISKTVVTFSLFLILLFPLLYFYDVIFFIKALLASLFSFSVTILLIFIFSDYLERILPETYHNKSITQTSVIDLKQFQFSNKELYCIQSVIDGQPYKVIASDLAVSESVVKKMMCRIFIAFNVDTRERLVAYFAANKVIYSTDKTDFPVVNSQK